MMPTGEEYYQMGLKTRDYRKSAELFEKAVALAHAGAMLRLAFFYIIGPSFKVEQDLEKARALSLRALELGNKDAYLHLYWVARKMDRMSEAVDWLRRGSRWGSAICRDNLGEAYYDGKYGLKQNRQAGIRYFRRAAAKGNRNSHYRLARMYFKGPFAFNYRKAVYHYTCAAKDGDKEAMHELAILYRFKHPERSRYWEQQSGTPIDSTEWGLYYWCDRREEFRM